MSEREKRGGGSGEKQSGTLGGSQETSNQGQSGGGSTGFPKQGVIYTAPTPPSPQPMAEGVEYDVPGKFGKKEG